MTIYALRRPYVCIGSSHQQDLTMQTNKTSTTSSNLSRRGRATYTPPLTSPETSCFSKHGTVVDLCVSPTFCHERRLARASGNNSRTEATCSGVLRTRSACSSRTLQHPNTTKRSSSSTKRTTPATRSSSATS